MLQYELFPPALIEEVEQIRADHGQEAVALYHKLSLCHLMASNLETLDSDRFIPAIRSLYLGWFERVCEDFGTQPDSYYDHNRPLWPLRKDLGVCSGRAIPVGGAWVIEQRLLARRAMIRRTGRLPETSFHRKLSRLFGRKDKCYVIHTVERYIQDFNSDQMNRAYCNIASLLQEDTSIWGIYRSSWFLDPRVSEISPDMAFLAKTPAENGAEVYDGGPCSSDQIRKATSLSPERSQLYESGDYEPHDFFYFWPRAAIINAFGESTDEQ